MALIECRNLTVTYGGQPAVEDLSFSVREGDYLCIIGRNGSGKTTLMKSLLGLIVPKSGKIEFRGATPRDIGYLPQQTLVQKDFPASVDEVVLSGCLGGRGLRPFYTAADHRRAAESLARVGVSDLKGRSFRALSGGQRQRVLLARALSAAGRLLLLDEPAAALDPAATLEMYELIDRLNREEGVTVLMVSHDLEAARRYARTLLYMDTRRLYFGGATEFFASDGANGLTGGTEDA